MWPFNQKPNETAQNLAAGAPVSGGPLSIGDRPMSLAFQLRRVADALDGGLLDYNWSACETCNCGLLVRALTGWSKDELNRHKIFGGASGIWSQVSKSHTDACFFNPGVEMPEFLRKLRAVGLEPADLAHVENLSHPELVVGIEAPWFDPNKPQRDKPANVAKYFRNWASKIEAFHRQQVSTVPTTLPVPDQPTDAQMEAAETRPLVSA